MFLKERIIIGLVWLICLLSLRFITKNKRRDASAIFLIAQLFAWILGIFVVEFDLISYPVREFEKANSTFFSFEYFVFPFICIFLIIYYPYKQSLLHKIAFYIYILAPFTLLEVLTERYTSLIKYNHWQWYYTFFSMWIVIYLVKAVYMWFFRLEKPLSL